MERPENVKIGDKFVVGLDNDGDEHHAYDLGEVVSLRYDDGTECPEFVNQMGVAEYVTWERLTPYQANQCVEIDILSHGITLDVCYQLVQADQMAGMAQAELDNAKQMLENRIHELNQLKEKYNIQ